MGAQTSEDSAAWTLLGVTDIKIYIFVTDIRIFIFLTIKLPFIVICFSKQHITETYFTVAEIISNHIAQNGRLEIAKTKAFCGYFSKRKKLSIFRMGWKRSLGSFWLVTIL